MCARGRDGTRGGASEQQSGGWCAWSKSLVSVWVWRGAVRRRTDRGLLALAPEIHVREADRVPVAEDRVLLLGERCEQARKVRECAGW